MSAAVGSVRRTRAGRCGVSATVAAVIALAASAVVPAEAAGTVERGLSAESPSLGRPIPYSLYRPAAAPVEGARWPVLYLFHGLGGGDGDWLAGGDIAATLDREIAAGRLQPMMVVMPMAGDSWYVDDPAGKARMASAIAGDLVTAIDARYPTAACREGRATGGLSMGGYGALLYAFDHPDRYAAAISLSGSIFPEIGADPRPAEIARLDPGPPVRVFGAAFGEPFDPARFDEWTLFRRVPAVARAPAPPAVWLEAGDDDFPALLDGTVRLHLRLRAAGLDSELRVEDGGHDWGNWRRAIVPALAWLSPKLDATCGRAAAGGAQRAGTPGGAAAATEAAP